MFLKKNRNACILIPIYKPLSELSESERRSLANTITILKLYDIYLFGPKKLAFKEYNNYFQFRFLHKKFNNSYFNSIRGYSILLLDSLFYKKFLKYKFLLIVQPDAWVFRDELLVWCNKGYDYIGAPWFEGWNHGTGNYKIIGVGNGGFSLRCVTTALKIIYRINYFQKLHSLWNKTQLFKLVSFKKVVELLRKPFRIKDVELLLEAIKPVTNFEDYYWTKIAAMAFSDFRIVPINDAMFFSFEVNPSYLYKLTNYQLPFGCHAWQKYEPEFWKAFITKTDLKESNELSQDNCCNTFL